MEGRRGSGQKRGAPRLSAAGSPGAVRVTLEDRAASGCMKLDSRPLLLLSLLATALLPSSALAQNTGDLKIAGALVEGQPAQFEGPSVEVIVRVFGPSSGDENHDRATVVVARIDSGLPWSDELTPRARQACRVPFGEEIRLRVPTDRRLGFVAYNLQRGYDERIVEAGTWTANPGTEEPRIVSLELPAIADAGRVKLRESSGERAGIPSHTEVKIQVPLTGVELIREGGTELRSSEGMPMPPGKYRLAVRPYFRLMCGDGAPVPNPEAGFERDVIVVSGEATVVEHRYRRAMGVRPEFLIEGSTPAEAEGLARTEAYLHQGWWNYGRMDEAEHWYVHATIQVRNPETGQLSRPSRMTWGWSDCYMNTERPVAPIDVPLYSVRQYPPGDYVMTVRGPRIKTKVVAVSLPADQIQVGQRMKVQLERRAGLRSDD